LDGLDCFRSFKSYGEVEEGFPGLLAHAAI
jgi:hypothetical protein